jgi:hypothetical protein
VCCWLATSCAGVEGLGLQPLCGACSVREFPYARLVIRHAILCLMQYVRQVVSLFGFGVWVVSVHGLYMSGVPASPCCWGSECCSPCGVHCCGVVWPRDKPTHRREVAVKCWTCIALLSSWAGGKMTIITCLCAVHSTMLRCCIHMWQPAKSVGELCVDMGATCPA